ncbi:MAG: diadenylate cyclase [Acidimicrobiales bacterium]
MHWLSAGRVGATLVLALTERARSLRHLDLTQAVDLPPLQVTRTEHFPSLLSVLAQADRAALVHSTGQVSAFGVGLQWTERAAALIPLTGGTRHTSARRFSFDEPGSLVLVVSEDGPVSVFADGALAAVVRADPCRTGFPVTVLGSDPPDPTGEAIVPCTRCRQPLLVDHVRFDGWRGGPERLPCPVCGNVIVIDAYRAAIRGVAKDGRALRRPGPWSAQRRERLRDGLTALQPVHRPSTVGR